MLIVRQSTAVIVTVGPVLDASGVAVTDGVVADFKLSKNGGAPAALNGSATLTHRHTGHYSLSLTSTDVNTVGTVEVVIDDTVNACAPKELQVVEEAVYDALFAASAPGFVDGATVDATKIGGTTQTARDLGAQLDAAVSTRSSHSAADVWTVGTRTLTAFAFSVTVGTNNDKTGYGLTAGERTAVANEVEAQIIDETDSEKVLTAITDKIAGVNPSLSGLTLAAIAAAVRDVSNASPAAGSLGEKVNATNTRVLLALPAAAPAGQGGLWVLGANVADGVALTANNGDALTVTAGTGVAADAVRLVTASSGGCGLRADASGASGIGAWLNATGTNSVGLRATGTSADVQLTNSTAPTLRDAVLTAGAITPTVAPNLDAAVSTRSSHSAADVWGVATRTVTGGTVTTLTNLPAVPNGWLTTAGIADDAITDAKIAVPAASAGRPSRILAMLRRVYEWMSPASKKTRNRTTGVVTLYAADGTTVLEQQTQSESTVGSVTTDQIAAGS